MRMWGGKGGGGHGSVNDALLEPYYSKSSSLNVTFATLRVSP